MQNQEQLLGQIESEMNQLLGKEAYENQIHPKSFETNLQKSDYIDSLLSKVDEMIANPEIMEG